MADSDEVRPDAEDRSVLGRASHPPDQTWLYGPHPDTVADVYLPGDDRGAMPVVLIHGGFWRPEYDRTHLRSLAQALADTGRPVISLEYRRIPGSPDLTFADLRSAIEQLPDLMKEWDRADFLLMGHSAGGHLALLLAQTSAPGQLAGCIALAPVADLVLAQDLHLDGDAVVAFLGADAAARSDLNPSRLNAPPCRALVIHGDRDSLVPLELSRSFADATGVPLRLLPDCGHYELIDPQSPAWPILLTTLDTWDQPSN